MNGLAGIDHAIAAIGRGEIVVVVDDEDRENEGDLMMAADRAATIKALVDPTTEPADLSRPGHIFPLEARDGGVLGLEIVERIGLDISTAGAVG